MTYEEVKEIRNNATYHFVDNKELLMLIDKAIEKQIPKKPLSDSRFGYKGICPNCKAHFLDRETNYCGNCGQALDWSENDK